MNRDNGVYTLDQEWDFGEESAGSRGQHRSLLPADKQMLTAVSFEEVRRSGRNCQ
uniref:Uncharacterized protein n=1 Tax=Nothobranchius kadleci TaxID=1051664 RepID=A0A1A8BZP2_NOTKA